jgi:predicted transcriptional regulator
MIVNSRPEADGAMTARISGAESQVMEILWDQEPRTTDEIVEAAVARHGWGPATVKTLINRLLKKKALKSERAEGRTVYRALLSREDYLATESQSLLDRLFDGQLTPLVAHYAGRRGLTTEERARLKALIEEIDDDS